MDFKYLRATALAACLVAGSAGLGVAQTTTTETETPAVTAEPVATTVERNDGFDWGWLGLLGLLGLAGLSGRRRDRHVPVHTDTTVGRTTVR